MWDGCWLTAEKQGISSRFLNFLGNIDKQAGQRLVGDGKTLSSKLQQDAHGLYSKAREADQQNGVSARFHDYYEKALHTPVGQRVSQFYQDTSKEILDVHEEAKRIAAQKIGASQTATPPAEAAPVAADAKAAVPPQPTGAAAPTAPATGEKSTAPVV